MELRFYEILGIRQWKKFVLWLITLLIRNPEHRKSSNYYLTSLDIDGLKRFKKMLIYNSFVHILGLSIFSFLIFINIAENDIFSFSMLFYIAFSLVNLYCVILQRYNWLRIKRLLKKKVAHK